MTWTGPQPVLYVSFDSSDGYDLMEGKSRSEKNIPLVYGQVNTLHSLKLLNSNVSLDIFSNIQVPSSNHQKYFDREV